MGYLIQLFFFFGFFFFFFFFLFSFFLFCTCGVWKFLGQGLNLHHSSDPGHCSDNRFLTHWARRELSLSFWDKLQIILEFYIRPALPKDLKKTCCFWLITFCFFSNGKLRTKVETVSLGFSRWNHSLSCIPITFPWVISKQIQVISPFIYIWGDTSKVEGFVFGVTPVYYFQTWKINIIK